MVPHAPTNVQGCRDLRLFVRESLSSRVDCGGAVRVTAGSSQRRWVRVALHFVAERRPMVAGRFNARMRERAGSRSSRSDD